MPHVHIRHFPQPLTGKEKKDLAEAVTAVIQRSLGVGEGAVSVALEPVEKADWQVQVYEPEITGRSELLIKRPDY